MADDVLGGRGNYYLYNPKDEMSQTTVEYERVSYEGGATRSPVSERYDLIPFAGMQACARRFAYGAVRHGDRNWESGGEEFAEATVNHLLKHAGKFSQYRKQDDLDAIICNAMMLAHFKTKGFLPEKEK